VAGVGGGALLVRKRVRTYTPTSLHWLHALLSFLLPGEVSYNQGVMLIVLRCDVHGVRE
jgi:hypothetical protein